MSKKCYYCSEPDSHGICASLHWGFSEFNISADYSRGKFVINTHDGDECIINFNYCPICGRKVERHLDESTGE